MVVTGSDHTPELRAQGHSVGMRKEDDMQNEVVDWSRYTLPGSGGSGSVSALTSLRASFQSSASGQGGGIFPLYKRAF